MAEQLSNNAQTVVVSGLNNVTTPVTFVVASAAAFPALGNFRVLVEAEILLVTAVAGTSFTATRAQEGSSAVAHANGATVTEVLTAGSLRQFISERAGFVNLLDYVAGDGTDESVGLLAAIAATPAFGELYCPIPPVAYGTTQTLVISAPGMVIRGALAPRDSSAVGSLFKSLAAVPLFRISAGGVKLKSLVLNGNNLGTIGIVAHNAFRGRIEDCMVKAFTVAGLRLDCAATTPTGNNNILGVHDSTFLQNTVGISVLEQLDNNGLELHAVECASNLTHGVVYRGEGLRVIGGIMDGNGTAVPVTSITRSGATATLTSTSPHGVRTGDLVVIAGATQTEYNGTFTATATSLAVFTYAVPGTPATPATGTITTRCGYGIKLSSMGNGVDLADAGFTTGCLVLYPWLEANASGGVAGGGQSVRNLIQLDWGVQGYTFSGTGEDVVLRANNSSGGYLDILAGLRSTLLTLLATTTGVVGVGTTAPETAAGASAYVNVRGTAPAFTLSQTTAASIWDMVVYGGASDIYVIRRGTAELLELSPTLADTETALLVRRNVGGTQTVQRVSMGAADSAGAGFKSLRVPN